MLQVCGHIKDVVVLVALHSCHHFTCCQLFTFHLYVNSLQILQIILLKTGLLRYCTTKKHLHIPNVSILWWTSSVTSNISAFLVFVAHWSTPFWCRSTCTPRTLDLPTDLVHHCHGVGGKRVAIGASMESVHRPTSRRAKLKRTERGLATHQQRRSSRVSRWCQTHKVLFKLCCFWPRTDQNFL